MLLPPIDDLLQRNQVPPVFPPLMGFPPMPKVNIVQQPQAQQNVEVKVRPCGDGPAKCALGEANGAEGCHKKSRCVHFTPEEENRLQQIVWMIGCYNWQAVASRLGTKTARQSKEKWYGTFKAKNLNSWSIEEDMLLVKQYAVFGPKWKKIAEIIPGRTSNSIRNRWKKLLKNTEKHSP